VRGTALDHANAFLVAARRLGANASHERLADETPGQIDGVVWTIGLTQLRATRLAIEALKQADLVIDLMFLLFSPEQLEIQSSGTRMLLVVEFARLLPTRGPHERVEASELILGRARMPLVGAVSRRVLGDAPTLPLG
jgi:2,5-dihydroxypyridine 5,6-dioxygenase